MGHVVGRVHRHIKGLYATGTTGHYARVRWRNASTRGSISLRSDSHASLALRGVPIQRYRFVPETDVPFDVATPQPHAIFLFTASTVKPFFLGFCTAPGILIAVDHVRNVHHVGYARNLRSDHAFCR